MSRQLPLSCLGSCYFKSIPEELEQSIESLFLDDCNLPSQVILVVDGPVSPSLEAVIQRFEQEGRITPLYLSDCHGLGLALAKGLLHCDNELVLRFDTDDISANNRISISYNFMLKHSHIAVAGTDVLEFARHSPHLVRSKSVPKQNISINQHIYLRNPLNHPSVIFRKSHILEVGGYRDVLFFEDYDLWLRLYFAKKNLANINCPPLVYMRRLSQVERREGWSYFRLELIFASGIYSANLKSFFLASLIILRSFARLVLPLHFITLPWRSPYKYSNLVADTIAHLSAKSPSAFSE